MTNKANKPVALITGASRGIGKAIAHKLASNHFQLALLARNAESLEEVAKSLDLSPGEIIVLPIDVNNSAELKTAIDKLINHFGRLDVAAINHGVYEKSFFSTKPGKWREVLNTNLYSAMELTELLLPYLVKSDSSYKSLFYTASVASHMRYAGGAAYCTSKHGLLGFAHCVFEEVRDSGLKVCALCPGFVNTDMINSSSVNTELTIQTDDIAEIVFNAMSLNSTVCPVEIIIRPQRDPYI